MPTTFTIHTECPASAEDMFDVSLDIDAHVASMQTSQERAIGGVTSGHISLGETVTWRARHFGIWFTMTVRIDALARPHRFVDSQIRGPFRVFRHEHTFDSRERGCLMTDRITVGSPIFGALVERTVLVPYLRRMIRNRNRALVDATGPEPR